MTVRPQGYVCGHVFPRTAAALLWMRWRKVLTGGLKCLNRQILNWLAVDSRNGCPSLSYAAYNLKTIGRYMLPPGFLSPQTFIKCLPALATTSPALRLNWRILLVLTKVVKLSVWIWSSQPCSWRTSVPTLLKYTCLLIAGNTEPLD